jgi:uncharacterized protein (UPF0254 family)
VSGMTRPKARLVWTLAFPSGRGAWFGDEVLVPVAGRSPTASLLNHSAEVLLPCDLCIGTVVAEGNDGLCSLCANTRSLRVLADVIAQPQVVRDGGIHRTLLSALVEHVYVDDGEATAFVETLCGPIGLTRIELPEPDMWADAGRCVLLRICPEDR